LLYNPPAAFAELEKTARKKKKENEKFRRPNGRFHKLPTHLSTSCVALNLQNTTRYEQKKKGQKRERDSFDRTTEMNCLLTMSQIVSLNARMGSACECTLGEFSEIDSMSRNTKRSETRQRNAFETPATNSEKLKTCENWTMNRKNENVFASIECVLMQ
jgi:hypothetical protein